MGRIEKLERLIKIEEAIQHFENQIVESKWSNEFGMGLEFKSINNKNTNNIDTYQRCINKLNEISYKHLFVICESRIKNK